MILRVGNLKFPTLELGFLCLTQDKKMPTFEINICVKFNTRRKKKSWKFFPLSRVKFYANVILKCWQFFLSWVGIFFVSSQILRKPYSQMSAISFYLQSEIFSFVSSQFLRKRYSQMLAIFFISSRKLFPSSRVKFYANVILKCRQFFYLKLEFFSLSLVKFYANIILKHRPFFYLESEIFSFVLTWDEGKHFRLEIKKICRYLRITFA